MNISATSFARSFASRQKLLEPEEECLLWEITWIEYKIEIRIIYSFTVLINFFKRYGLNWTKRE
jgi:hypothetical protein